MQLEQIKPKLKEEGYLHSAEYAALHGLTKSQIEDRVNTRKVEYKRVDRFLFIKATTTPNYVDQEIWLTAKEYSQWHCVPLKSVQNAIKSGRLQSKRVGERCLVPGTVSLTLQEKIFASGKRQIFWTPEEKQKCTKSA